MHVLMLGWEFPPHISGGLGTACYGLTQGLREHEVRVDFVVPRVFGDEDQRYVELLSCEATLRARRRAAGSSQHGAAQANTAPAAYAQVQPTQEISPTHRTVTATKRWFVEHVDEHLTQITVDSPLHPYLTPQTYSERLRLSSQFEHSAVFAQTLTVSPPYTRALAQAADAPPLHEVTHGEGGHDVPEDAPLFTGKYGRSLILEVYRYASAVEELAATRTFDVIHAHDWMTYPAAIVAKQVSGKPLVVHLHASEFDRSGESPNTMIRDIEARGFAAADLIICVSHYTASILHQRYHVPLSKLRVVHNAVVHTPKSVAPNTRTIPEQIVLFLGRITFQKGPEYFLQAAARVIAHEPATKFVMAGDGDMLKSMIELTARLGIARNVHFTGFLRGPDVERMYAMADLYIMPSVSEPFGIAPLEAMALDVPVIVSRQSGVSEVLRHALKVDFWDVEELANKIISVLRQPALRQSLVAGGQEELQHMQWSYRAEKVIAVYKEALS